MKFEMETHKEIIDDAYLNEVFSNACKTKEHVWFWTSMTGTHDEFPPYDDECDCGRYIWADMKDAENKQVENDE